MSKLHQVNALPQETHFAILVQCNLPECSWDCDAGGQRTVEYEHFDDQAEWISRMEELAKAHRTFVPLRAVGLAIKVTHSATIEVVDPE